MEYRVEIQPLPGKLATQRIAAWIVEQAGQLTPQLIFTQQTAVGRTGLKHFVRRCSPRQIGQAGRQFPGRQRTLLRVFRLDQVERLRRNQGRGHHRFIRRQERGSPRPLGVIQSQVRGHFGLAGRSTERLRQKGLQGSSSAVTVALALACRRQQMWRPRRRLHDLDGQRADKQLVARGQRNLAFLPLVIRRTQRWFDERGGVIDLQFQVPIAMNAFPIGIRQRQRRFEHVFRGCVGGCCDDELADRHDHEFPRDAHPQHRRGFPGRNDGSGFDAQS